MELTFEQARVLGSLIEKQMTTPDHYPLTVNALVAACNQKNNREPVTSLTDIGVERILVELNDFDLARFTRQSGGRTLKYLHRADQTLEVDDEQLAILAIMMLRGPQTVAELKSRTERYMDFADRAAVASRVDDLITRDVQLVVQLPRESGQREDRFMTLLVPDHPGAAGEIEIQRPAPSTTQPESVEARVAALETTVAFLLDQLGLGPPTQPDELNH